MEEELGKLSKEIESFKSNVPAYLALDFSAESIQKANQLKERACDLRKQMRSKAFNGRFIRLVENDFLSQGDIIGSLWRITETFKKTIVREKILNRSLCF